MVTVVGCCCLAACICMVCPLLSNGLVQLVCEDGGIVSLLILPQPRPFMRPSRAQLRGCDGTPRVTLRLLGADVDDVVDNR